MQERDTGNPETADELGQKLLAYVQGAEFGTPQFQAISDYLTHRTLEHDLGIEQRNMLGSEETTKRAWWESRVRITEIKIALLEYNIDQNQARLAGYSTAYTHMGTSFEEVDSWSSFEADEKYPDDDQRRKAYLTEKRDRIYDQIEDIVWSRKG